MLRLFSQYTTRLCALLQVFYILHCAGNLRNIMCNCARLQYVVMWYDDSHCWSSQECGSPIMLTIYTTTPSLERVKCSSILIHYRLVRVLHNMRRSSTTCVHKTSNHRPIAHIYKYIYMHISVCKRFNKLSSLLNSWTLPTAKPQLCEDNSTQTQTQHSIHSWRFMLLFILWCVTLKMFIYTARSTYIHVLCTMYIEYTLRYIQADRDSTFIYISFYTNI